jgi:menaquinone-dependent protoporphyrinogen oxidase
MSHILIAYDTTEGQTRKIAQRMADAVAGAGHEVQLNDIRKLPSGFSVDQFDAAVVGASIHLGKHSRQFTEFVVRYRTNLEKTTRPRTTSTPTGTLWIGSFWTFWIDAWNTASALS